MRLNITRFDTEANFDFLWILRLDSNGFQDVLQQLSGAFYQVTHLLPVRSTAENQLCAVHAKESRVSPCSNTCTLNHLVHVLWRITRMTQKIS